MKGRPAPGRVWALAGLALVLLVALAARLRGANEAFHAGAFVPADGDALYHLRRMQLSAEAWPRAVAVDPWLAWPDGGAIPWAPGFDLAGAAVLRLGEATGVGGWLAVGLFHLALALLLVAATVEAALFLLPAGPGRLAAALAAGLVVALLPQAVDSTSLGNVDHHVVEALVLLGLARWALEADAAGTRTVRWRTGFEVAGAVLAGAGVLCFTGTPLYVALVLPLLAGPALAAERPRLLGSGAPALLGGALLAAAGTAPLVAAHGRPLAFGFPSWLQPALVAAAAAGLSLVVLAGRLAPPRPRWRRPALLALLGAGAALAALAAAPALWSEGLAGLSGWLLRRDPWLARIDEFQPMWRQGPLSAVAGILRYLGVPGLLLPAVLPPAALALAPAGRRRWLGAAWLLSTAWALAMLQVRFGRVAAPWIGLGLGLALAWAARALAGAGHPGRLAAVLPLAVTAVLALADPQEVRRLAERGDPLPDAGVELALELRGWPADPAAPGVLAPWDLGDQVLVLGGRPVVAAGFGSYPDARAFEEVEGAFRAAEPELLEVARRRRLGVVAAGAANLFGRVRGPGSGIPFAGRDFDPTWLRAIPSAPLLIGGSAVPALGVRHDEHLLPRFASTRAVVGIERPLPVLWGYEIVRGARLEGLAPPSSRAVLEVPLEEHGRPHTWRAFADAGPDGRWTMTVPLPTDLATPTVRTAAGRLRVGDGPPRPLAVPEAAVRQGQPVAVGPPAR